MTPSVLVPVKPFAEAKSRLSGVLSDAARRALCRRLLARTLDVLGEARRVRGVIVVSRDAEARALAAGRGVDSVAEPPGAGLNDALAAGAARAAGSGADSVLVLPSDLPVLAAADVDALVAAAPPAGTCAIIAPDVGGDGTNALLLSLPAPVPFRFGPGSFAAHCAAARAAGVAPVVVRRAGLARDLDSPADYARLGAALDGQ